MEVVLRDGTYGHPQQSGKCLLRFPPQTFQDAESITILRAMNVLERATT